MSDDVEIRSVAVNCTLDDIIENTRGKIGMIRSAFYKYAAIKLFQDLSILSETVHKEVTMDD